MEDNIGEADFSINRIAQIVAVFVLPRSEKNSTGLVKFKDYSAPKWVNPPVVVMLSLLLWCWVMDLIDDDQSF